MESNQHREPWNKGKLVGQKPPLKPKDIWAIRDTDCCLQTLVCPLAGPTFGLQPFGASLAA
jgi:hypothetical protein